ncbi:MAG: phosphatidylglycerophosphatase A [Pelodictyon luteolum]|uniref:Phosphatidylglycerophosphatase A n=1 Tax=Pelodictyon luteolum TaxID=1100 RepID=A0A165LKT0_PELLU|nr:phosphatidylglycerophosphatase A [Pelodictyon luteolum]KZK74162.1 MAG: phosphatidylglycerophosphatase A [Pelodictyon luteolum]
MNKAAEGTLLRVARVLSTCFFVGYFPLAPGTLVSALAVLLYLFVPVLQDPVVLAGGVLLSAVLGVWSGGLMEESAGLDPSEVTIDELSGQWLALLLLPAGPVPALLAFLFFRLYDILKPGPVDMAQRLPGGWGIMADDLLAGLFANVSVRLVLLLVPAQWAGFL